MVQAWVEELNWEKTELGAELGAGFDCVDHVMDALKGEYTSLFLIIPCNSKIIKISSDYWNMVGPLRVCLSLHKSDQKMKGTSGHFFLQ